MSDDAPKALPQVLWFILGLLVATLVFESVMVAQLQASVYDLRETVAVQQDMIQAAKGMAR